MELVLRNAEIIAEDGVFRGSLLLRDGRIADISSGQGTVGEDCEGDYLAPGLIDLHTDNLEKYHFPRANIDWDPVSAAIIHDGFCLSLGVTTVFDALSVGSFAKKESRRTENLVALANGVARAHAIGALKASHHLHWRCELTSEDLSDMLARVIDNPMSGALSLMDHTPGQRQYRNIELFLKMWRAEGALQAEIDERVSTSRERQAANSDRNRRHIAALGRDRGLPILAHDDETPEHVDTAVEAGAVAAEFPVTEAAARRSRERGMVIIMGGPNLIRGGSYSGNVGAAELADLDLLDAIASDYVPRSMLESPFVLASDRFGWPLHRAFATVTAAPARIVGLADRGAIAPGLRADLIRIRRLGGHPVVKGAWVEGRRVA
jgi:alpha-D-ribose 1-methylphosphonate 5-triphosphate diphosphatase